MEAAVATYRKLDVTTEVASASPKALIEMLFEGATAQLQRARGCIAHDDIEGRNAAIIRASEIIDGLRTSLDLERGGELAANLHELYGYMLTRLFRGNADHDDGPVREVLSLLATIADAWSALDDEVTASTDLALS